MAQDKPKKKNGGAGRGQGRKKGSKAGKTIEREFAIERIRQHVYKNQDKLIATQMAMAQGSNYIAKIFKDDDGILKTAIVKDEDELAEGLRCVLDPEAEGKSKDGKIFYQLRTDKPDGRALENLLDRAHGRPAQSVDLGNKDDKPFLIQIDS